MSVPTEATDGCEVAELYSADALDRLADEWSAFRQAQASPLLTCHWFAAAAELLDSPRLRIVTVRRDGKLVGIAPLAESRRHGVSRLELVGSTPLYEPGGLLAADEFSLAPLCAAMIARRQPIALLRVSHDGPVSKTFARCSQGHGYLFIVRSPPILHVDLQMGFDAYLATRPAEVLANARRKFRRLQASGVVEFESVRPTPGELDDVLEEAIDVEADGWKGRAGSAMRHNAPIRRFVMALAARFAAAGELRVNFLRSNGTAVAMNILLEYGGTLWGIKKGYRDSARNTSPGMLLLHETLRDMCKRGVYRYEFLGSGDRLQPDWATGEQHLQTLVYYPYSFQGALAFAADVFKRSSRRRRPAH